MAKNNCRRNSKRNRFDIGHPRAHDLKRLHVPVEARADVRRLGCIWPRLLRPWRGNPTTI